MNTRFAGQTERAGPEIRSAASREHVSHASGGLVLPDGIYGRVGRAGGYAPRDDAHHGWKIRRTSQSRDERRRGDAAKGFALRVHRGISGSNKAKSVGFEATQLSVSQYGMLRKTAGRGCKWNPVTGLVASLRMHKDAQELAVMRRAAILARPGDGRSDTAAKGRGAGI